VILTVGSTKGGVGKSALATLAITWARAGRDVLLVDGDKQGSAQKFIAFPTEGGRQPALVCVQYGEGRVLRDQVRLQTPRYQDVITDADGYDSTMLGAALLLSDAVLVPFLPRTVDVLALGDMAPLIEEPHSARDGLLAMAVLNIADPGLSSDNADAVGALAESPQLSRAQGRDHPPQGVPQRGWFGPSVDELLPPNPKPAEPEPIGVVYSPPLGVSSDG
jgi:chromosome partitioning protein